VIPLSVRPPSLSFVLPRGSVVQKLDLIAGHGSAVAAVLVISAAVDAADRMMPT
jgi:hypothetical protein